MSRYAACVDPFIGVDGGGNCLPGPYLPHSLVRLGPDVIWPQPTSGYRTGTSICRFSHTHVSGTGGNGRYGNIGVVPFIGPLRLDLDAYAPADEEAAAGYYAVTLGPAGIRAELTVTPRVGVHRYTFPAGSEANLLFDLGAVIQMDTAASWDTVGVSIGGYVEALPDGRLLGRADLRGGWGHDFPYSVNFVAEFSQAPQEIRVADNQRCVPGPVASGPNCRAVARFGDTQQVEVKIGISFVSVAKARASIQREADGKCFDTVRGEAEAVWDAALSRVRVQGGTKEQRTLFYTFFTRLVCMPSDLGINDEHPDWESPFRHFSDFYCLWDSVRNANSLITLIDPDLERDFLNCLLDVADHTGWVPDAWIAGHSAHVQGGCSADILFCEAALKGLEGIDYEHALLQMRKNAEVDPPDPSKHGRYLSEYRDRGFVSTEVLNCVSRHLEYGYQDWCAGRLAEHLGQTDVAAQSYASARKVWTLWRDDIKSFSPKKPSGTWVDPFDPVKPTRRDYWNDPYFYEGTGYEWSLNVQHDYAELIKRHGGAETFVQHLDRFFDEPLLYHWKEIILHVPYLYIYAGRPDKTAERVRQCLSKYYACERNGLPDNEDMGCQSAFYMASSLGLYPFMGQDIYFLTTPAFTKAEIELGDSGKALTIEAPQAGTEAGFISAATLDGEPLDRAWVRHQEIKDGGKLQLELTDKPTTWGTNTPPPWPMAESLG